MQNEQQERYSCDGDCYRTDCLEVRVLPSATGGNSNAILCRRCYEKEMTYRRLRNTGYDSVAPVWEPWDLPKWEDLKVYKSE